MEPQNPPTDQTFPKSTESVQTSNPSEVQTGLVTSLTPKVEATPDTDLSDIPVESGTKSFPSLTDDQPISQRWHSRSSRLIATQIRLEDCILIRTQTGEVQVFDREAFEDKYAPIQSRKKIVGPNGSVDVIITKKQGLIVLEGQVASYDSFDAARKAGYQI